MVKVPRTAVLISALGLAMGCARTPGHESSITGKVTGKSGPEAGVWVIAETDDLETGYTKTRCLIEPTVTPRHMMTPLH